MKSPRLVLGVAALLACQAALAQPRRPLDSIAAKLEPTRSVVYKTVGDRALQLHLFEPDGHRPTDRRPVFLTIHGGGWTGGNPRRAYPVAEHFARLGLLGVSLEYRLLRRGDATTVFDCVQDGRSAVRYLREQATELGADPQRIVVSGNSAGGHLAVGTALFDGTDDAADDPAISCRPDLLVLYYPVIDTSPEGYGQRKIGDRWRELSPVDRVKPGLPPTLVLHGTADTVTPYVGATRFQARMRAAGNDCELVSQPDGRHGYFIFDLELYAQAMERTRRFLELHRVLDRQPLRNDPK